MRLRFASAILLFLKQRRNKMQINSFFPPVDPMGLCGQYVDLETYRYMQESRVKMKELMEQQKSGIITPQVVVPKDLKGGDK